jgi:hypothetical protein
MDSFVPPRPDQNLGLKAFHFWGLANPMPQALFFGGRRNLLIFKLELKVVGKRLLGKIIR